MNEMNSEWCAKIFSPPNDCCDWWKSAFRCTRKLLRRHF